MIFPTQQQLELFKKTEGAFSVHEFVGAINVAAMAPYGTCSEQGSHRGKSSIANAIGLSNTPNKVLHMTDPLYDVTNVEAWSHSCQGHPDNAWCGAKEPGFNGSVVNVVQTATGGDVEPELHGDFSEHSIVALHDEYGDFAYIFIDTDVHAYDLLRRECDLLLDRVKVGGIISFHDFMNQHVGVEQVYREMLQGGNWLEISIDWDSIKNWVGENGGETGNVSWHACDNSSPCFYGAIIRVK